MKNRKDVSISWDREDMEDLLGGTLIIFGGSWICFHSLIVCAVGLLGLPIYLRIKRKGRVKKRQKALWNEFRDATAILYSSTAAGGTLEKAFRDVAADMLRSGGQYQLLLPEFQRICAKLDRNVPMEEVLREFAERNHDEDIRYFVQILLIAKKSGGSLADIIRRTSENMQMRMEIDTEIETILTGKRGEWLVMLVVPPFIVCYMNVGSADYMAVLYETWAGRCVMGGALFAYIMAIFMGRKILDIHV